MTKAQLQAAADSSALAGAAALYETGEAEQTVVYQLPPDTEQARVEAQKFARFHLGGGRNLDVNLNLANDPGGDIVLGYLYSSQDEFVPLDDAGGVPNAVRVEVPLRSGHSNGPLGLFFGRVLGISTVDTSASAIAVVTHRALLPFVTSEEYWGSGGDGDDFAFEKGGPGFGVDGGSDGEREYRMFPGPWNGEGMPPGNFGVIQIGPNGMTMTNVRSQVDTGPSVADIDYHGGSLHGSMELPGRTGLKSSSKIAFLGGWADGRGFNGIVGSIRQLPLYSNATGNGANAVFTISRFVTVRVMALEIDGRVRTDPFDTEGNEITSIIVQPVEYGDSSVDVTLAR